jgi:hypothetical protein
MEGVSRGIGVLFCKNEIEETQEQHVLLVGSSSIRLAYIHSSEIFEPKHPHLLDRLVRLQKNNLFLVIIANPL